MEATRPPIARTNRSRNAKAAMSESRTKSRTWEESFKALEAYKEKHGNCRVPSKYKDDPALGRWVEKTRRKVIPNVSQQQLNRLTELGFDWETLEEKIDREWEERFALLKQFKAEMGHSDLTVLRRNDPLMKKWGKTLGIWANRQRDFARKGRLRSDRRDKLLAIGFDLGPRHKVTKRASRVSPKRDEAWMSKYNEFKDFRKKHGHSLVTLSDDRSLHIWVKNQREANRRGLLRRERKELLDLVDFVWKVDDSDRNKSHHQKLWDGMFAQLEEFKRSYGHVRVIRKEPHTQLAIWLDHQRTYIRRQKLDATRTKRLVDLGVDPIHQEI